MDPQDRLRDLVDGVDCGVCRCRVPPERLRLLAQRDDLAFVEMDCPGCGSVALGIVLEGDDRVSEASAGHGEASAGHAELLPEEEVRLAGAPPIGSDDVIAMRRFLAAYRGDLRTLLRGRFDAGSAA